MKGYIDNYDFAELAACVQDIIGYIQRSNK